MDKNKELRRKNKELRINGGLDIWRRMIDDGKYDNSNSGVSGELDASGRYFAQAETNIDATGKRGNNLGSAVVRPDFSCPDYLAASESRSDFSGRIFD